MRGSKRLVLTLFLLGVFCGPALTGCGALGAGKTTLDFWTFWGSEIRRPVIEKIIEDFNKSQDEIEVEHTYFPYDQYHTKVLAAIAGGNPPDVVMGEINDVRLRAQKEQIIDLSQYRAGELEDRFYPQLWDAVLHEGRPHGLPFVTDTRMLFYNKDMFEEAGLDPEKPPETWAELVEYADGLDRKQGGKFERLGFFFPSTTMGADFWMINGDGGRAMFDESGNPIINRPGKVEALEWTTQWRERYGTDTISAFYANLGGLQNHPFLSGKVAMFADLGTFYTQIRDYGEGMNFGVAPMPAKTANSRHWSVGGGFAAEIPKGSDNPEAAWRFARYLTGVDAQTHWAAKNFDNVANIEASRKAAESPELNEEGKTVYAAAMENLEVTVLNPIPATAPGYSDELVPQLEAAFAGKKSPKAALDTVQREVEEMVAKSDG